MITVRNGRPTGHEGQAARGAIPAPRRAPPLTRSLPRAQNECQVSLNTVDSIENLVAEINNGRWDAVLPQVASLKLPRAKLEDLYEQIVLEMIELREIDTARAMLRQTQVFQKMKQEDGDRCAPAGAAALRATRGDGRGSAAGRAGAAHSPGDP